MTGTTGPGRLDIRSVSVRHEGGLLHSVKTYEGWTNASLGDDSYFVVVIDTNFDADFERCAFIFYANRRLRGALTNCARNFITTLAVSRPSRTVATIKIPRSQLPAAYRWAVFSYWTGPPAKCSKVCFDAAPNRPPPILHDLKAPVVTMSDDTLIRPWELGTDPDFDLPFTVTDAHSGVRSWTVERSPAFFNTSWSPVLSGTTSGSVSPTVSGTPPGRWKFRVVGIDRQGNKAVSAPRYTHVPTDVTTSGPGAFSDATATETSDTDAWGGGFVPLDAGETYTLEVDPPDDGCLVELVGPGSGDWSVQVSINGSLRTFAATEFQDSQRQTLFSWCVSDTLPTTFIFTVQSGSGFGVDAVVI